MKLLRSSLALFAALALPALGLAPRASAQDEGADLYKKVVKSCVFIVTPLKGGYGMGSGSLIDLDKKLVLTNFHVVDEEETVYCQFPIFLKDGTIMNDKQEYLRRIPINQKINGKVLYRDKSRDLAIVRLDRVPAGTPALPLAKKSIDQGSTTWNIGSPGELKQVFGITKGEVRSIGVQSMLVGGGDGHAWEVRARVVSSTNPVNPGDSGGPLFDKRGYQVAVTQSKNNRATLLNSFIDIQEVREFLKEKKIQIKELSDEPDPKGTETAKKDPKKDSTTTIATGPKDNGHATPPPKNTDTATVPDKKDTPPVAAGPSDADEKAAADLLRRAGVFANDPDNKDYYAGRLREVIKKYPGTVAAKDAQKKLDGLK